MPIVGITWAVPTTAWGRDIPEELLDPEPLIKALHRVALPAIIIPTTSPTLRKFFLDLKVTLEEYVDEIIKGIDGLILSDGPDIDPGTYGERPTKNLWMTDPGRDELEVLLVKKAFERDLPTLAIGRGMHILNISCDGTSFQDLSMSGGPSLLHLQTASPFYPFHEVRVEQGTLLRNILAADRVKVNSFHHQAIKSLGKGLRISARSDDGVIEAVEAKDKTFVLGVQFHPEFLTGYNENFQEMFVRFADAVRKWSREKG